MGKTQISRAGICSETGGSVARAGSARGLTLIELTILLLILGILYSLAMPKLYILTDVNLRTSARRLAETLRVVQSNAIAHASQYVVRFDIEKGTYGYQQGTEYAPGRWVFLLKNMDGTGEKSSREEELRSPTPVEKTFRLEKGVFFQDIYDPVSGEKHDKGEIRTEFSPRGIATPALIHIGDSKSRYYTIAIERYGGRVILRKGNLTYEDLLSEGSKQR